MHRICHEKRNALMSTHLTVHCACPCMSTRMREECPHDLHAEKNALMICIRKLRCLCDHPIQLRCRSLRQGMAAFRQIMSRASGAAAIRQTSDLDRPKTESSMSWDAYWHSPPPPTT